MPAQNVIHLLLSTSGDLAALFRYFNERKVPKYLIRFSLSAYTVSYELAVQPGLICRCIMETHVSYSERTHTHMHETWLYIRDMHMHTHTYFFLTVFHSEASKNGEKTEEILFLVEMRSIFRVPKWMDCKKVNLIIVQPLSSNN